MSVLGAPIETLRQLQTREIVGSVSAVRGLSVLVDDLPVPVGALVRLERPRGSSSGPRAATDAEGRGEVIGLDGPPSVHMLFWASGGIAPSGSAIGTSSKFT